jgi:hypothetical protein
VVQVVKPRKAVSFKDFCYKAFLIDYLESLKEE